MQILKNARIIAAGAALCGLVAYGSIAAAVSATGSNTTGSQAYRTITIQALSGGLGSTVTDEATFGSLDSVIGVPFVITTNLHVGTISQTIGVNAVGTQICSVTDNTTSGTSSTDCPSIPARVNHFVN